MKSKVKIRNQRLRDGRYFDSIEVSFESHSTLIQRSAAATATTKDRRVYRRQQRADFELVRESKVIWEHLRVSKNRKIGTPAGKTLALEEIMALAKGHFKEVRYRPFFDTCGVDFSIFLLSRSLLPHPLLPCPLPLPPSQLALKHDTARVVQSSIKNGSKEHRSLIFSELKG